ncbi:MAG: NAD(P)H-dependent oxidoreductase [Clostridia bacterium]
MKTILFINACIRNQHSRTLKVANAYIQKLKDTEDFKLIEKNLYDENISYLTPDLFGKETGEQKPFPTNLAEEFANADEIILAAPFWEFMFPAVVNCYFERVSCVGVAFKYTEKGSVGLCKSKSFKYIYTAGNYLSEEDKVCEKYLKKLCELYGIQDFSSILVDGLDIQTNNAEKMIEDTIIEILE